MKSLNSLNKQHTRPPKGAKGYSALVHNALILTGRLGEVRPLWLFPVWVVMIGIASWPWAMMPQWFVVTALSTLFLATDWLTLALLPYRRRSWGPVTPSLLALTLLRTLIACGIAWILPSPAGLGALGILHIALSALVFYTTWIEPFNLHVTHQSLRPQFWTPTRPLRLLHISDVHFEGLSPREHTLLQMIPQLNPDLIVLTGDYLNLSSVHDPTAQAGVREMLAHLSAPLGVYAVTGSPVVDVDEIVPGIFESLPIHWLQDEVHILEWQGQRIGLVGLRCTYDQVNDSERLEQLVHTHCPDGIPSILLYHTPDLMPDAARLGITLYLAGHTHGGQIRAPFYGALVTSSSWGKRYEMGRYQEGSTTLYVSRGLGVEGLGAPRARFLAPPEIILWEFGAD